MSESAWGRETKFFFDLTPDKILDSIERFGLRCTGRCLALNSMENRVFEVEIETADDVPAADRFRVAKFYRPGRWSKQQILEEHEFLADLDEAEIPVVPPLKDANGETLLTMKDAEIYFTLFPKLRARCDDDLNDDKLEQVGRLLARMHIVGAQKTFEHRIHLSLETYGENNLEFLMNSPLVPENFRPRIEQLANDIFDETEPRLDGVAFQRIHADAHVGNLLWQGDVPTFVDFDDVLMGPVVQDIWLLTPGRDEESLRRREKLLAGYQMLRDFDHSTLTLIEPLRSLRMIHFAAWIAKRWDDPAFQRVFPTFGDLRYWAELVQDLSEQLEIIREG